MEDARKDAPMSGDNEREPETERSVEVAKVETAGDRAWQTWRSVSRRQGGARSMEGRKRGVDRAVGAAP